MLLERYRIQTAPWILTVSHIIELVVVLFIIGCLRAIAPLSIIYLLVSLYLLSPLWHWAILIPTIPEAFFFLLIYLPRREILQRPPTDVPPPLTQNERQLLFSRIIQHLPQHKYQQQPYPAGWFLPSDQPPHRQNIREWLLFILFSTPLPSSPNDPPIPAEWDSEIDEYVHRLELARGEAFPEGFSSKTKLMRLSFDRVPMCHRPLAWYAIIFAMDHLCAFRMWRLGFSHWCPSGVGNVFPPRLFTSFSKKSVGGQLSYWYRPPSVRDEEDPLPTLILFHGIGTGIFPYIPFVQDDIHRHPNQGILFIEVLQISTRMTGPICSRPDLFQGLCNIFDDLELTRLNLLANSYGTLIGAMIIREQNRIMQAQQEGEDEERRPYESLMKIQHFILVDMVAFCLHLPDLPRNFVYRQPKHAYEWVIWYFSGRDSDVIRTLGRHFFWQDYILWKEDLPFSVRRRRVAVVLGGVDCILPTAEIKRYLTGGDDTLNRWVSEDEQSGLELMYLPEEDHATVFAKGHRDSLLDVVDRYNDYL